ncbi:MAG: alpha/beta hydrolase [Pseudomonadota bacterium]
MSTDPQHIRPLETYKGARPPAPAWFERALQAPSQEDAVTVAGASIRYSVWGERGKRGLMFVHGGRAHRNWWRPFAPFFTDHFRVAALDLSGMGDSDWRERYSMDCLVDEVCAVMEAAELCSHGRPFLVGHSFGGWVTLATVEREGERLAGAVVVDSPVGVPDPDEGYTVWKAGPEEKQKKHAKRLYETIEEPIARFRFLPNQPCTEHYLVDYIAREGLARSTHGEGEGWTWKFDPYQGTNFDIHFDRDLFLAARCPLGFIYGEESEFVKGAHRDGFDHLRDQARSRSPVLTMPAAHHHLMMDQPIAFVSALRMLFSCWPVRTGA